MWIISRVSWRHRAVKRSWTMLRSAIHPLNRTIISCQSFPSEMNCSVILRYLVPNNVQYHIEALYKSTQASTDGFVSCNLICVVKKKINHPPPLSKLGTGTVRVKWQSCQHRGSASRVDDLEEALYKSSVIIIVIITFKSVLTSESSSLCLSVMLINCCIFINGSVIL